LAWRVKLPAILFLLLAGIVLGPLTGLLEPDKLLGDLLFPIVSLSVALILFEGSLSLRFHELPDIGHVVRGLVSYGAIVALLMLAAAAHYVAGLSWEISLLFGALTCVTGPTVIAPMLRTVRPNSRIANVLRWEGIVIDPLGALFAVLAIRSGYSSVR
jgi:NhaP-type Na+/H+ or K+/H+ antiporter